MCHAVVEATWTKAVDNAATDNAAAQFSDVAALWSTPSVILVDGASHAIPPVPVELEPWAFFQNIDRYESGDQLILCLNFTKDHPYGDWMVSMALTQDELALPPADEPEANPQSAELAGDLEKLNTVSLERKEGRLETLIALVQEQPLWSDTRNLGQELSQRPVASQFLDEFVAPDPQEVLASWRTIPAEVRSLLLESELPVGHGLSFSPLQVALIADKELATDFDGIRFITDEGYVLAHVLPLNYPIQPLSQTTVTGLDIRVVLHMSPKNEGEIEKLVDVGTIEWETLEPATPISVSVSEDRIDIAAMRQEEFDKLLLNSREVLTNS